MGKNSGGQPSGPNKEGLGIKPVMPAENLETNEEMGENYIKDQDELAKNLKEKRPDRNRDKEDSTNVKGYRQ